MSYYEEKFRFDLGKNTPNYRQKFPRQSLSRSQPDKIEEFLPEIWGIFSESRVQDFLSYFCLKFFPKKYSSDVYSSVSLFLSWLKLLVFCCSILRSCVRASFAFLRDLMFASSWSKTVRSTSNWSDKDLFCLR